MSEYNFVVINWVMSS